MLCFVTMSFGEYGISFLATLRIWLLLMHSPQGQARSAAALVLSPVLLEDDILHWDTGHVSPEGLPVALSAQGCAEFARIAHQFLKSQIHVKNSLSGWCVGGKQGQVKSFVWEEYFGMASLKLGKHNFSMDPSGHTVAALLPTEGVCTH